MNAPTPLPKKLERSQDCPNFYSATLTTQYIKELYVKLVGVFANAPTAKLEHSVPKKLEHSRECFCECPSWSICECLNYFWESLQQ